MQTVLLLLLPFLGLTLAFPDKTKVHAPNFGNRPKRDYDFKSPLSGKVQLCFDCDIPCMKAVGSIAKANEYFDYIAAGVTQIYKGNGIPLTFEVEKMYENQGDVSMMSMTGGSSSKLQNVNINYWHGMWDRFVERKNDFACDAAFFGTTDYFFAKEQLLGFASSGAMCTNYAHGYLEVLANDKDKAITNLAHELGHMMGMPHDKKGVPNGYGSADVKLYCEGNSCPDTPDTCVMENVLMRTSDGGFPTTFSDCSRACFKEWSGHGLATCIGVENVPAGVGSGG